MWKKTGWAILDKDSLELHTFDGDTGRFDCPDYFNLPTLYMSQPNNDSRFIRVKVTIEEVR